MKLIKSDASIITELDPYKKVELVGRTCYRSEDNITEGSAYKFVANCIKRQHFAMLEHASVHFVIKEDRLRTDYSTLRQLKAVLYDAFHEMKGVVITAFQDYAVVTVSLSHLYNPRWKHDSSWKYNELLNQMRLMFEAEISCKHYNIIYCEGTSYLLTKLNSLDDLADVVGASEYKIAELKKSHEFISIQFVCDRGVSHELVRHRCSVAQESTRYCNYSKDKFDNSITFVEPNNYETWDESIKKEYEDLLKHSESTYMKMLEAGMTPQQARAVLPNSLKTIVILTMSIEYWGHFFNLRSIGTTGAPHPDMKEVADIAFNKLREFSPEFADMMKDSNTTVEEQ